ncbi:hypothetical protein [Actinoplanes sp. NPDC051494]|uniref:hypothetical protein n=1 Tax=Actinoplanes sp. NPDC051494 TaxID=3363907 RepID=UPI0037A48E8E
MLDHFVDDVRANAPAVITELRADLPAAVCHDELFFIGSSVAGLLGVPEIRLVPHFAENAHVSLAARMVPFGLDPGDERLAAFGQNAFRLAQEIGPARDPAASAPRLPAVRSRAGGSRRPAAWCTCRSAPS